MAVAGEAEYLAVDDAAVVHQQVWVAEVAAEAVAGEHPHQRVARLKRRRELVEQQIAQRLAGRARVRQREHLIKAAALAQEVGQLHGARGGRGQGRRVRQRLIVGETHHHGHPLRGSGRQGQTQPEPRHQQGRLAHPSAPCPNGLASST